MPKPEDKKEDSASAKLIVSLPADATLLIDGRATTSTTARRVFESPALEAGKVYEYTLTASLNDDVQTKNVAIRAGANVEVSFDFATATIAAK